MTEAHDEFQEYLDALRTWAQRANGRRGEWIIISELQMTEQDQRDAAGLLETGIFAEQPKPFARPANSRFTGPTAPKHMKFGDTY